MRNFATKAIFALALVAAAGARASCDLTAFQQQYSGGSLFNYRNSLTPQQMSQHNDQLIQYIRSECTSVYPTNYGNQSTLDAATFADAEEEISRINNHPIASLKATSERDTAGNIGFCFGRAFYMHLDAIRHLHMNIDMVRKLWVIGKHDKWGHHVTTIVKAREGGWWALDPITGAVEVEQWMRSWASFGSSTKDAGYFITDATRFGPYNNLPYRPQDLQDPFYKGYFEELLAYEGVSMDDLPGETPTVPGSGPVVNPPPTGPTQPSIPGRVGVPVRAVLVWIPFSEFGLNRDYAERNAKRTRQVMADTMIRALANAGIKAKIQLGLINHINWNISENREMTKTKIQLPNGATTPQVLDALQAAGIANVAIRAD